MALYYLNKSKKVDLVSLCDDLGLEIPEKYKIADLVALISESEDYDEEFTKTRLEVIVAERTENSKQIELNREYELRKLEIESKANISSNSSLEPVVSKNDLLKLMQHFNGSGDISVYLALFERQISRINVSKEQWVTYLLGLLPLEIINIISRESGPSADDYEYVKNLLLQRFKLNPEQFRQKFVSHKKESSASWRDYAFDLRNFFEEWIKGLEIKNFDELKELIITNEIKQKLPTDLCEHFIDDLPKIKSIDVLVNKLDEYEAARRNIHKITNRNLNSFDNLAKKSYTKESENTKPFFRSPNTYRSKERQYSSENGLRNENKSKIKCFSCNFYGHRAAECRNKDNGPRCTNCNYFGHLSNFCPQRKVHVNKTIENELSTSNRMEKMIEINGKTIKILFDTGSDLSLISYESYVNIGSPKLSFDNVSLAGISKEIIYPIGFFPYDLNIDNCVISLNLYVLKILAYDMILGTDVINKLNLSITESGIQILSVRNNFRIGYVKIVKNAQSTKQKFLKCASDNEMKSISYRISSPLANNCIGATESFMSENSLGMNKQKVLNISNNKQCLENNHLISLANAISIEEIDLCHIINSEYKNEIKHLIENYTPRKTKSTGLKMNIILSDDIPIYERPRRFPLKEQQIIENQIEQWLNDGIIRPSCSDYAAPVVLCKKKDNTHRLCIDYRRLNRKIIKDRFPLPLIEDVLDRLEKSKVFTTLDLKNGFFHVEIDEKSRKYTAFVTHHGIYEYLKCPFGLCLSPNYFQRFINTVFRELLRDNTIVIYMDDIVIPSQDEEEGLRKLKRVLSVASDYGLEINFKKCQFLKRKIEFLGHIIENETIQPSPSKTLAVQNFPQPKSIKQVQSFLGLTGYFRKFIAHYSQIAKPLSDLLRKDYQFKFGPEQIESFNKLKNILSQKPVLHIFRQGSKLELHTDASSHGFGAVLLQESDDGKLHPIQYMSRKTTTQQEKYCSYELEVLAIIEALKKFRNYLLGSKFKIITDCAAFQKTLSKKELAPKVARWALFIEEFDYEIVHRPGNRMKHVDALSRNTVLVITRSQDEISTKIAAAQEKDEHIKILKMLVEKGEENSYLIKNNILYKFENGKDLIVVPEEMQIEIVRKIHNKGHFAVSKTEELVKQEFFIPKLRKQVETVIYNCIDCILYNRKHGKAEGYLNPIPKDNVPLSTYHIDHIGPLPSTNKRYQYIFTIVDSFTKFTWFYPVRSTSAQEVLEKLKLQQTVFGNPARIISDRGTAFTAKDFEDYCLEQGIEHIKITTGIPRANGQVERIHNILIPVLSKISKDDASKWYKHVSDVQRIINSSVARSTKYTPFELMIGTKMKNKDDLKIKEILNDEYQNCYIKEREDMREEARKNIMKIQEENRKQFNKKRKKANRYKVNDIVAIQRTQFGKGLKLKQKFHGPYRVTTVKPNDRYDVEKIGNHEGPINTSSAADFMKPWSNDLPCI